ncbi:MAG: hypothetical protein RL670_781 [Actinomycetota bacterium]|jgi:tetratricopeptide (TPR) repeat protein
MSFDFWGMSEDELASRALAKNDEDGRIICLGRYASYLSHTRRFDEAIGLWRATYDECLPNKDSDNATYFFVSTMFASALIDVKEYEEAHSVAIVAAEAAFEAGDYTAANDLYIDAAESKKRAGKQRECVMLAQKAVRAASLVEFAYGRARANNYLADAANDLDLNQMAADAASVAAEVFLEGENFGGYARAKYHLGNAYLGLKNYPAAEDQFREAWVLAKEAENRGGMNLAALGRGKVYAATGNYKEAVKWLKKCGKGGNFKHKEQIAEARWIAADITAKHLDPEKGKKMQAEALDLYSALKIDLPKVDETLF